MCRLYVKRQLLLKCFFIKIVHYSDDNNEGSALYTASNTKLLWFLTKAKFIIFISLMLLALCRFNLHQFIFVHKNKLLTKFNFLVPITCLVCRLCRYTFHFAILVLLTLFFPVRFSSKFQLRNLIKHLLRHALVNIKTVFDIFSFFHSSIFYTHIFRYL